MHGHDWKWQRPTGWHFKFWPIPQAKQKNSNERQNERNNKTDRMKGSERERERLFKVLWKYDTDLSLGNWYNQMRI